METTFKEFLLKSNPDIFESRDLRDFALSFGMEQALRLIEEFGGGQIYVPQMSQLKNAIKGFIKNNYDGQNIRALARHCNITPRFARKQLE